MELKPFQIARINFQVRNSLRPEYSPERIDRLVNYNYQSMLYIQKIYKNQKLFSVIETACLLNGVSLETEETIIQEFSKKNEKTESYLTNLVYTLKQKNPCSLEMRTIKDAQYLAQTDILIHKASEYPNKKQEYLEKIKRIKRKIHTKKAKQIAEEKIKRLKIHP